jgi:hypothetical protein
MTNKTISGIGAAWLEADGLGQFSISGRKITFTRNDGLSVSWTLETSKQAAIQLRVFRAATKYPETRDAA